MLRGKGRETLTLISRGRTLGSFAKSAIIDLLTVLGLKHLSGPKAVEANLILGLKKIGVAFNINPSQKALRDFVCVLSDYKSVQKIYKPQNLKQKILVGPNISARHMSKLAKNYSDLYKFLAPSQEVKFTYIQYGVPEEKIAVWPVGIDTEKYQDTSKNIKNTDALVYFKRRQKSELTDLINILNNNNQTYKVFSYGGYRQEDLIKTASACRYAVILDGTESQGIAIQELMALNLPLFVLDQIFLGDSENEFVKNNLLVSSVPYWDDRCGFKVPTDTFGQSKNTYYKISEASEKFQNFLSSLQQYSPRQFILDNLSLEKQARAFINLFD